MELRPMVNAGICGFKCFLIHSGVDEFKHVTEEDLHLALPQLEGTGSVLLVRHIPSIFFFGGGVYTEKYNLTLP